ncbi:hypothetical protein ABW45_08495 [Stenotrophomonas maltophilia]|nr:hypothetical protein [Stenotrophomonas pavanii]KOQ77960.1 hypothetical protein ABW45_08495 [Stenotrophomonas maltophilia]
MSITRKTHWMFVAAIAGTLALAACSPPQNAESEAAKAEASAPVAEAATPAAKPIDALTGLKIVGYGPTTAKASTASDARVDVWATADRSLEGYQASLWLNGQQLENAAVSGVTATGTLPASLLATPGTYPLEIRIGENGELLTSEKVDFVIE